MKIFLFTMPMEEPSHGCLDCYTILDVGALALIYINILHRLGTHASLNIQLNQLLLDNKWQTHQDVIEGLYMALGNLWPIAIYDGTNVLTKLPPKMLKLVLYRRQLWRKLPVLATPKSTSSWYRWLSCSEAFMDSVSSQKYVSCSEAFMTSVSSQKYYSFLQVVTTANKGSAVPSYYGATMSIDSSQVLPDDWMVCLFIN